MRRVVSLYLPNWPADRAWRKPGVAAPPPDVPLALVGRIGRRGDVASGIVAQAVMADSRGAAHALACWLARATCVAPAGESAAVLQPLPIAARRLPGNIVDGLLGLFRLTRLPL
jgi:hypothetical protein